MRKIKIFGGIKMKIKNVLIMVFVFAALPLAAYSISKISKVQVTTDISLENVRDCQIVYWDEAEDVYGTCTYTSEATVCDDPPLNTSCHTEETSYEYECKTGTQTVQKSKEVCKDNEMQFAIGKAEEEKYNLEYGEWGKCSYETEGETLIVTCDSMYDGNNDGICKPGESCIQFRITKEGIQRFEKNSRYDWVENDNTFFLEKLDVEVVK